MKENFFATFRPKKSFWGTNVRTPFHTCFFFDVENVSGSPFSHLSSFFHFPISPAFFHFPISPARLSQADANLCRTVLAIFQLQPEPELLSAAVGTSFQHRPHGNNSTTAAALAAHFVVLGSERALDWWEGKFIRGKKRTCPGITNHVLLLHAVNVRADQREIP